MGRDGYKSHVKCRCFHARIDRNAWGPLVWHDVRLGGSCISKLMICRILFSKSPTASLSRVCLQFCEYSGSCCITRALQWPSRPANRQFAGFLDTSWIFWHHHSSDCEWVQPRPLSTEQCSLICQRLYSLLHATISAEVVSKAPLSMLHRYYFY